MRVKPPFLWLLEKESRELAFSSAWWILVLAMGPLTGMAFISAMRTYAEVSGLNGTSAGVGEALSPLIGVWAPTFSACELAAVFLLPFVAIRLVAVDRRSGALKLEIQQGMAPWKRIVAKALVLVAGWLVAMLPAAIAIGLWRSYGGSLYGPEVATIAFGHLLNAGLTIALGAAVASFTEHPSTAAILTLSITVATWIVSFGAAVHGGWWERAAAYTPAAMVAEFQHGLIRLSTVVVVMILILAGSGLAALWMRVGVPLRHRTLESAALGLVAAAAVAGASFANPSWDTSESRGNSFSRSDERALRQIGDPLQIEVHLAPEDPRRVDLERGALSKLRRVLPRLRIQYVSKTSIGLFEQTSAGYGEIWYMLSGRKTMSRATTEEGVLEAIYSVAGVAPPSEAPPSEAADPIFRGHPLAAYPKGAGFIFYGVWPAAALIGAILTRRGLT
jgi:hypothetical protein